MQARREVARQALLIVADKVVDSNGEINIDLLIQFADQVRDALAPFDSGIREAVSQ